MALFDADADGANARFAEAVEIVRSGQILARDQKAYGRWRRDVDRQTGRPPDGKGLAALAGVLGSGLQVVRGEFEFRN